MFALQQDLDELILSTPSSPSQDVLEGLVKTAMAKASAKFESPAVRVQWELCLRDHILSLAETEGEALSNADSNYYQILRDRMDLILVMTEQGACDGPFPFVMLEELIETQTIHSCSYVFAWMEDRSTRLTKGMEPQKGKALVLLRTLNELLRRLSKTAHATFCGRILTFLSGAFSLGDRSGVNLRGEYGPAWDMVQMPTQLDSQNPAQMDVDPIRPEPSSNAMAIDSEGPAAAAAAAAAEPAVAEKSDVEKKEEFYRTFWSLQDFFSRPNKLVQQAALQEFQTSVNTVLPVISEANKKERLLMGSKAMQGSTKRKRDQADAMEESKRDYFFAKFLTSPDLLDLEMADALFRRQILFQLLIILQYLQLLTKGEKAKWHPPRNRSLLVEFTLEPTDAKWVMETTAKAFTELRATAPLGKEFADTVAAILQRERNWISWKNEICPSFERPSVPNLDETAAKSLASLQEPLEPWEWKYGTEALTELFEMGYRDMADLEDPPKYDDFPGLVKQIKAQDKRIDMRKKQIELQIKRRLEAATPQIEPGDNAMEVHPREDDDAAAQNASSSSTVHHPLPAKPGSTSNRTTPAPPTLPSDRPEPEPTRIKRVVIQKDRQLETFELTKQKLSWLALRVARNEHWQLFTPAKGNPEKMMWLLERNKNAMSKDDEYSFNVTGWVEGDTTVIPPPKKPKIEEADDASRSQRTETPNGQETAAPSGDQPMKEPQ